MGTVTEYLSRIIRKQKEIGYKMPQYVRPGLTDEQIGQVETKLGFLFNEDFREYLRVMNGMEKPNEENGAYITFIPTLFILASVQRIESFVEENVFGEIKESYVGMEGIATMHIPILSEGHVNCYWVNLDANDKFYGYVLRTTMWGDFDYVYSSVSKMFETICTAYEKNCIFLKGDRIDISFTEYRSLAKIINSDMEYWQK